MITHDLLSTQSLRYKNQHILLHSNSIRNVFYKNNLKPHISLDYDCNLHSRKQRNRKNTCSTDERIPSMTVLDTV